MAESDRIVVDFAWKYVQLMQTSFDECQALLERADGEAPSREEIQRCENIVEFCKMEAGSLDIAYKQGKKLLEQSCEIINRFKNIHQQENIDGSKKIPKASSGKYVFSNKDEIVTLLSSTEFSLSEKIEKLWRFPSSRDEEILIVMGNAAVTIGGFKTLAPRTWLDDIAISAYMILINRRGLRTDGKFHCYCCNSNLYQVLVLGEVSCRKTALESLHQLKQIVGLICGLLWGVVPVFGAIWIVVLRSLLNMRIRSLAVLFLPMGSDI
ncbi:uncharacterized protein LOC113356794 isoform X2 [Papaver somniferum]|uniref:uncharacterized protein LOC113356794 isoform X2 n=1 Tax=Papaver somniferum TaxID=3469 RepID=UPI000E701DC0|nr:uncharacterized protein LOC113356794 isoform X2 [Papaver somniferum]